MKNSKLAFVRLNFADAYIEYSNLFKKFQNSRSSPLFQLSKKMSGIVSPHLLSSPPITQSTQPSFSWEHRSSLLASSRARVAFL